MPRKNERKNIPCIVCGTNIGRNSTKYCTLKCQADAKWTLHKTKISDTGLCQTYPSAARRYISETRGWRCEICSIEMWNGQQTPLVLDHIDGNSTNWLVTNLRLICPNCDAQTPTYKGRNMGKGRFARRQRYADGLSY